MNVLVHGWRSALGLALAFILAEAGTALLGGDVGGFLWVTVHFAVLPLLSLALLVSTLGAAVRTQRVAERMWVLSSLVVPLGILYLVINVSAWIAFTKWLGFSVRP